MSTQSSEVGSSSLSRRVLQCLAGVLLCVLVAELGLRALQPFDLHRDWEHPLIAAKEERYTKFARRDVDVLIVGSSLAMGLDAKRLSELTKRRVFNGSIAGLTAAGVAAVMAEGYAPIGKPKLVIYPLSMRDIRGGDAFSMLPFFSHKMREARPSNWQGKLEVAVEDVSYLFRVRRQIRHSLVTAEKEERIVPLDDFGTHKHVGHRLNARLRDKAYARKTYNKLVHARLASATSPNAEELSEMIEFNRANGVETVLVNMPISPAAMDRRLAKHYKTYMAEVRKFAKRVDVPFYDALGKLKLDNAHFNDFVHVGPKGDKRVEDYLLAIIERHLDARQ